MALEDKDKDELLGNLALRQLVSSNELDHAQVQ